MVHHSSGTKKIESNDNKFEVPKWREILYRIPNARNDWNQKKPLQKFAYLYGIGRMGADVLDCPTFREDQTLTLYSYLGLFVSTAHILLMLFTVVSYAKEGTFEKGCPCTCFVMGCIISTYTFLIPILSNQRYMLHSLVAFGARYIYRNHHEDAEYQRICSTAMDKSMKRFLTKMLMITFGYTVGLIGPVNAFVHYGIRTTTVELRYPFVEEKSWTEFAFNNVLQGYYATYGGLLYIASEVILDIFSNIIKIWPRLIEHKLKQIISAHTGNTMTPSQLRIAFTDFTKQCIDANDYVRNVGHFLSWRSLLTPVVFSYAIGMSIFCQYKFNYTAGYGLAIMGWIQLFYICELGESVTDNEFVQILYDSDWYLLPPEFQKDIIHLINRQQNAVGLRMGPFASDLNREIFKIITNKIYSFVMFLLNFNQ